MQTSIQNMLFIGNSFTFFYDVPYLFESIARYAGRNVHAVMATQGGAYLREATDPDSVPGANVANALENGLQYDRIILQEQSSNPVFDKSDFLHALETLLAFLRISQPSAEILLYQTWGYGDAYPWDKLPVPELDHDTMTTALAEAYKEASERFGLRVVPVGTAMHQAYRTNDFRGGGISVYEADEKHPNYRGALLSAMTHFFCLYPEATPDELPDRHVTHTEEYEILRKIAYDCTHAS